MGPDAVGVGHTRPLAAPPSSTTSPPARRTARERYTDAKHEFVMEILDLAEDDLPAVKESLKHFDETGEGIPWEQIKAERGL